jgi:murein DD-endopeptidase MepM/ murein hydrolase activator NlpD
MDAPRTARLATRRGRVGALLSGAALFAAILLADPRSSIAATTTAAVDSAVATPTAFVPDWDGHTDSTVLEYRLLERSVVVLRVLDARGRTVDRVNLGTQQAGVQQATWDGRSSAGRLLDAGTYRLRIDARPASAASASTPQASAFGGAVIVAGARSATVTLQRPKVALTAIQLSRASIGRARSSTRSTARFRLSAPASISAAVVDDRGRVVRMLTSGRSRAGVRSVSWDGRTAGGSWASDGTYALVVSATGGARPTSTNRLPLLVDRVIPTLTTAPNTTATVDGARITIPLSVQASEPGSVLVRVGRRLHRVPVQRGTTKLTVPGSDLGLAAGQRGRSVSLIVQLQDDAGNTRGRRVRVSVPARTKTVTANPTPTPPPPTTTTPVLPTTPGTWPWPVGGIVTSEFGLRWGRRHEGLDIAVPSGTDIHPSAAGTVAFVGSYGGYGNLVMVDHPNGIRTYYAHMSKFGAFTVGSSVTTLDVIGKVGCTGSCTGPHVHFETRAGDTPKNPRAFLIAR